MFKHKGKTRTFKHNLQLASLLSFVAGIVNVTGFLSVKRLTTNVTGHFAFFVDEIFKLHIWEGFIFSLYIISFFLGSFVSNLIVEIISRVHSRRIYIIPIILESLILTLLALFGEQLISHNPDLLACSLLFSMGLQNSLVTTISNATVRTTHLTGLFTDLGIDLSQLIFFKEKYKRQILFASIKLRLTIITFFFCGGLIGGILYSSLELSVLIIAAAFLIFGMIYDDVIIKLLMRNEQKSIYKENHVRNRFRN